MFESLLLERANQEAHRGIDAALQAFTEPRDVTADSKTSLREEIHQTPEEASDRIGRDDEILRHVQIPGHDITPESRFATEANLHNEIKAMQANDKYITDRHYNAAEWYLRNASRFARPKDEATHSDVNPLDDSEENSIDIAKTTLSSPPETSSLPPAIRNAQEFEEMHGFSLLKKWRDTTQYPSGDVNFHENLDLWAEMPRYTRDMYFLYLISRRRNTYAVIFDIDGKCIHTTMSAGKLGLKHGEKGWRSEGSSETGHMVASKYLDLVYPKLVALENTATGAPSSRRSGKIQLVVRVMGFYNGRQGALKALVDRRDKFVVCYMEDVTPIPRNGPRMPKSVY